MFVSRLNIPNALTLFRILLTPVFVGVVLYGKHRLAFWIFMTGGFSDALDGALARILNQKTMLGTLLDPIADKIFLSSAVTVTAFTGMVPLWIAIVLVSRDIIVVSGVVLLKWVDTPIPIRPHFWGKVTTLSEIIYLFLVLLKYAGYSRSSWIAPIGDLAVGLAVVSGVFYVSRGIAWFQVHKS